MFALAALLLSGAAFAGREGVTPPIRLFQRAPAGAPSAEYVPGEVLVRVRSGASKADTLAAAGLVMLEQLDALDVARCRLEPGDDVRAAVDRLRRSPDVAWAEPNYLARPARVPGDPYYANVDGAADDMQRWTFGAAGVAAEAGWDVTTGRPDVTIAVIDSGVDFEQEDLARNLWANPGEVPGNNRDDDGNAFVDDFNGWDFISGDVDPSPDLGNGRDDDGVDGLDSNVFHGTFSANCAAARGDDGVRACGAAWGCRVLPLKVFTDDGAASTFQIAAAVRYAADNGADVINLSLSTTASSEAMRAGVEYARARDCVVVAAAGNGNSTAPSYPAGFDGVLAVGASDHAFTSPRLVNFWGPGDPDGRAPYSQYGALAVDVVAPGTVFAFSVASVAEAQADPDLRAGETAGYAASGTSFSAPIVAGLAALLISRDKDLHGGVRTLDAARVADVIRQTARDLPDDPNDSPDGGAGWDGHGLVDFPAALGAVAGGGGGRTVRLGWKPPAAGDSLAAPAALRVLGDSSAPGRPAAGGPGGPGLPNSSVTGYRVYRAQAPGVPPGPDGLIATVGPRQLWFVDAESPEGEVFYVVTAVYGGAEGAPSDEASPRGPDADAPAIVEPAFAGQKLRLRAENSKIQPGAVLVVNGTRVFALSPARGGALWVVKKAVRSPRGGKTIGQVIPPGGAATLQVINSDGSRSAEVAFQR
jgi:subtilisin family serine protease